MANEPLAIVRWPDPILAEKAKPVPPEEFGPGLAALGFRMRDAMKARNGLGLAGPQVGLPSRMFVMKHGEETIVAVNPALSYPACKLVTGNEACLSLPGVEVSVARWEKCHLFYQEPLAGEKRGVDLEKLEAVCAQHENDHLDGVLIIDKTSRQQRKRALRDLEKASK